ncbi:MULTISPECIES: hypothetical protein [unclassified Tardiphaga]|uniref:hypothetical protein n=1 Tax=unclassified Tardiphaga TaxID=2631404 RepID=UPI001FED692C|nr:MULTISPECIES: hypothetical protein [unclassified Tardiphaga]
MPFFPVIGHIETGSTDMKLSAHASAAAVAATVFTATFASAQDVPVRVGDDRGMSRDYDRGYFGQLAEYRGNRGWHRGWRNRDRVVMVKHRRQRWD